MPEDVVTAACEVHEQLQKIGDIPMDTTDDAPAVHLIAAAILAERQRCSDVARHLNGWGPVGGHRVAEHIAQTILNP
ncbi:hypothetical protein B5M44_03920 [Shinella sumterensis]|nr:hypothetical protein B5M44_03920 [Shinella sumterensis]